MNVTKKEKKLKYLNKAIAKGRTKTALHFALIFLVGIGISKIFTGNALNWLFMKSWMSFIIAFTMSYALVGKKYIRDATEIISELGKGEIATPPKSNTGSWITFFLILALLTSPTLFKEQIKQWAIKGMETAVVDLKISSEDRGTLNLKIPQLYIVKQHNTQIGLSLIGKEVTQITLVATLDDMKPLPLINKQNPGIRRHQQSPARNPNIIILQMRNELYEINKNLIDSLYKEMTKNFSETTTKNEMGLEIKFGKLRMPKTTGVGFTIENVRFSVPTDPNSQNIFIACDQKVCTLITYIEPVSVFHIHFHPSELQNWKEIYKKSEKLIKGFIQE